MSGDGRARGAPAFAMAVALHAALLFGLARSRAGLYARTHVDRRALTPAAALTMLELSEPPRREGARRDPVSSVSRPSERATAHNTVPLRPSLRREAPPDAPPSELPEALPGEERPRADEWSLEGDAGGFEDPTGTGGRPTRLTTELVLASLDRPSAAPTRPRRARHVTAQQSNEAVRSLVRMADRELGLGAPQETKIAHAVQDAGRASGVPSGTSFSVTLTIDKAGTVTSATIRGDDAGEDAWPHVLAMVRGALEAAPIPLGPDERVSGATVRVDAKVLHVLPSGSEHPVTMGECPKMPQIGGEEQPSFFKFGGTPYLDPPNGLCVLGDAADVDALRTIVVRTTTTTTRPGDAPKPLSAYPKPPTKKLLPNPMEELIKFLNRSGRSPPSGRSP